MRLMKLVMTAGVAIAALGAVSIGTSTSANAWYCSARGTTGAWGAGWSGFLAQAKVIALRECAVRTPRGATCYIMYCK